MRKAGKALNLTIIIVETVGMEWYTANSTCKAQRKESILFCDLQMALQCWDQHVSITWKFIRNSDPRPTEIRNSRGGPTSCLLRAAPAMLMPSRCCRDKGIDSLSLEVLSGDHPLSLDTSHVREEGGQHFNESRDLLRWNPEKRQTFTWETWFRALRIWVPPCSLQPCGWCQHATQQRRVHPSFVCFCPEASLSHVSGICHPDCIIPFLFKKQSEPDLYCRPKVASEFGAKCGSPR